MARYKIITLIDITRTNASRSETDRLKIGQQANFNSFIQSIGLRSNITWERDPKIETGRLPHPFEGKANHWYWEFDVEREDVFLKDNDPVKLLREDLHGVPIVVGLNETSMINPSTIQTQGNNVNTYVDII